MLVTGGAGFIGRAVLEALRPAGPGWEIVATHSPRGQGGTESDVVWREVDLLDDDAVRRLLADIAPSHLIHLAWASHHNIYQSSENHRWAAAGRTLLDLFSASGGRRAVFAGTCAEYDWLDPDAQGVFAETATLGGGGAYGEAKRSLQTNFDGKIRSGSVSGAWARLFFLYGPHEPRARLVPAVVNSLLDGRPAETTHGEQVRDYLYVGDAASALVGLLASDLSGPVNIGSGEGVRLKDLIAEIASQLGAEDRVRLGAVEAPEGEAASVVADTTRLTVELGWRAAHDRRAALAETIEWWRERRGLPNGA